MRVALSLAALALVAACSTTPATSPVAEAQAREMSLAAAPPMRWGQRSGSEEWTRATMQALEREGVTMISRVPADINEYCPNYSELGETGRKVFWAGLLSAVARHESTFNPQAAGGGGRWLGLMQIAPATWRHYGCDGNIKNGADNMSCAVKIMARQVGRDNAVAHDGNGWRGVARDWAPMRSSKKRADIAAWTSSQSYCSREG
ncbi:lytic transglycosylase domain-containing protein [Paracoccus aestuarii]|uniref:Lytic transglycosylase domain-containing protein n=1 Tax=Paracoccus aestuarii TaxID=453842 RepID=A0A418ZRZ5_9RHOB|nr:lytic transglycosylase domain-containing protein [Paracoccus aestuarii]RJK99349.1 lytic transglycosylase domain-containing protein [Paracoccus aestuarii]WCQ99937.1 lytic transglycosylase domain-containing protein [Paracoccus aestuarii]